MPPASSHGAAACVPLPALPRLPDRHAGSLSPTPIRKAAAASQSEWFSAEVQPHESMLRAWLRRQFPSLTDVDDVVQEAFVRVLRARENGARFEAKSYLFATARNLALDLFRRKKVVSIEPVENIQELSVMEDSPSAPDRLSRDEDLALLAQVMESLPPACRNVLVLQKMHRLSYQEIATRLGISERTVNAQIAKGVLRIRDFMRAHRQNQG